MSNQSPSSANLFLILTTRYQLIQAHIAIPWQADFNSLQSWSPKNYIFFFICGMPIGAGITLSLRDMAVSKINIVPGLTVSTA